YSVQRPVISLREIGGRLGADAIVTMSARRTDEGRTFDVTARLVRVPAERELWSRRTSTAEHDVFTVQAETTRSVASVLGLPVVVAERRWPTQNPDAYELYLRGRTASERGTNEGTRLALTLFGEAIARDPAFAQAHAAIADMYLRTPPTLSGLPLEEAFEKGK